MFTKWYGALTQINSIFKDVTNSAANKWETRFCNIWPLPLQMHLYYHPNDVYNHKYSEDLTNHTINLAYKDINQVYVEYFKADNPKDDVDEEEDDDTPIVEDGYADDMNWEPYDDDVDYKIKHLVMDWGEKITMNFTSRYYDAGYGEVYGDIYLVEMPPKDFNSLFPGNQFEYDISDYKGVFQSYWPYGKSSFKRLSL